MVCSSSSQAIPFGQAAWFRVNVSWFIGVNSLWHILVRYVNQ